MGEIGKTYAITLVRLVLGVTALLYGIASTFGVFGGSPFDKEATHMADDISTRASLSSDWIFMAGSIGLMVCGLALVLGTFARAAALLILVPLLIYGVTESRFSAFFIRDHGCEHLLFMAALCSVTMTHGAGALQLKLGKPKK